MARTGVDRRTNSHPGSRSHDTGVVELVDAFYGPTYDRARSRGARRSSLQHVLRGALRPVRGTG